jgi:hypothetical protein
VTDTLTRSDLRAQLNELEELLPQLTQRGLVVLAAALDRAERRVADLHIEAGTEQ